MAVLDATLDAAADRDVVQDVAASLPENTRTRKRAGTLFWIALGWIGLVVFGAMMAGLLPIPSPTDIDMMGRRAGPSGEHWLGTDGLGRDEFSRLLFGARISLSVGLLAPIIGLTIGGALGMLAGYFRGKLETLVAGGVDVVLAFPPLVLAMAVTAYLGQSVPNLILVLGFLGIPAFTRVARAATLSLSQREFVTAARAIGASHSRILLRELLPNVALPLMAFFLLAVAVTIVVEGALSFLGLGVPPPAPSWGIMIGEGRESLDVAPWLAFTPAIAMFLTVLAFNLVGDTLRALTDPRPGAL
jgi:peptide/nickel transport system permease protein